MSNPFLYFWGRVSHPPHHEREIVISGGEIMIGGGPIWDPTSSLLLATSTATSPSLERPTALHPPTPVFSPQAHCLHLPYPRLRPASVRRFFCQSSESFDSSRLRCSSSLLKTRFVSSYRRRDFQWPWILSWQWVWVLLPFRVFIGYPLGDLGVD
uniref:Uncharacterized protein n=1 Tax=Fagus sylvatica TaxID=28930 RepID=A0A2N9G679_FAGSY